MKKINLLTIARVVAIPVCYALLLHLLFSNMKLENIFGLMSVSFLFLLPAAVGVLTIFFSADERVKKLPYRICAPWIPVCVFVVVTMIFAIEGWPCLLMILPVFLLSSSVGGLIGGYFKLRQHNKVQLSMLVLIPLLASPIEHSVGPMLSSYTAYTYIDIDANPDVIWGNVTRVSEIDESDDKGTLTKLLNFPRPVKAELNFEGVGAYREAIFTNGLVFHETVTEYQHKKKMSFTIRALPHEIPLTTMDEHLVVGGKYFDVLNGTYELEKLGENKYRLHLSSNFKLKTTFNFYASLWASAIMKDIQNNILQIQKRRSELIRNHPR